MARGPPGWEVPCLSANNCRSFRVLGASQMQVGNRDGGNDPKLKQYLSHRHGKQHWCVEENLESLSLQADGQSAAQLARTQKLALLKLTALMDRYSPSSKQGWNW